MRVSSTKQLWQESLSDLITDPNELLSLLALDPTQLPAAYRAAKQFSLKVPRQFVDRMEKGNPNDPLLKQVLPLGIELDVISGYGPDPLQEAEANPIPGLLHKYATRVLVTLTSACAVHCRYCFRRHFPYEENNPGRLGWEKIFNYIKRDEAINEVILSGGDPLSVSDSLLASFSDHLNSITHIKTLRVHTRLPIVLPERVTEELLAWIKQLKQNCIIVFHVNHPREINKSVEEALKKLRTVGAHLLNQSVLLKDVNDNVNILASLSETLFSCGVLPYYLHILDKVKGAAHFDLPLEKAQTLHQKLTTILPGYLVPRLVIEEPGKSSKTAVSSYFKMPI